MAPARVHIHHENAAIFRDPLRACLSPDEWEIECWESESQFIAGLPEAEYLLAFRPPRGHWERAGRLRYVQMTGAGVDALLPAPDLPAAVRVANARGIHGVPMGEFALAMMLAFEKRIPTWLAQQREKSWQRRGIHTLRGKTVAILGLGSIGEEIVRMSRAMGVRVVGTRRGGEAVGGVDRVGRPEDSAELMAGADYVVILLPLTPETRGFVGAALLDALPRHAVLINLARGGIVDEAALIARLESGCLRGAAIDVFEREPLPPDDPIWKAPNTILTPHVSGWFLGYGEKLAEIFSENLEHLARGERLRNEVDRERGY